MDFSSIKELESKNAIKAANKQNICFVSGSGNRLFDTNNRSYLDLSCGRGESCLGYNNPLLTSAITAQAQNLIAVSDEYYSEPYGRSISKLIAGTGYTKALLMGSASDAALMSLALIRSYLKEKGDERTRVVIASDTYYSDTNVSHGTRKYAGFNNFDALKKALTPHTAILVIEPIISDGGVKIADYDYLVNAYALCKSMDIILFCDETRIGIGRTGKRFCFEHYGIQPDIVALSRGLAGGMPVGALLTRDNIAAGFKAPERAIGSGAGLLSCVAAGIVLDRLDGDALDEITEKGEYLLSKLYKLTKYNFVLDVRGKGLLSAIELSGRIMAAKVVSQMEKLGYLLSYTDGNVIRFSPSFTITTGEIDEAIDALTELFSSTNI